MVFTVVLYCWPIQGTVSLASLASLITASPPNQGVLHDRLGHAVPFWHCLSSGPNSHLFSSVAQSCLTLWPHGPQHTRTLTLNDLSQFLQAESNSGTNSQFLLLFAVQQGGMWWYLEAVKWQIFCLEQCLWDWDTFNQTHWVHRTQLTCHGVKY